MEARISGIILCIMGLVLSANPTLIWKLTVWLEGWISANSMSEKLTHMDIIIVYIKSNFFCNIWDIRGESEGCMNMQKKS